MSIIDERIEALERKREFEIYLLRTKLRKPNPSHVVDMSFYREQLRLHVRAQVRLVRNVDAQLAHLRGLR